MAFAFAPGIYAVEGGFAFAAKFSGKRLLAGVLMAGAARSSRSRAGSDSGGGGTPGIAGPSSVFMAAASSASGGTASRNQASELPPILQGRTRAAIAILRGIDIDTPEGRYILAAMIVLLDDFPLPQDGFKVIGEDSVSAEARYREPILRIAALGVKEKC